MSTRRLNDLVSTVDKVGMQGHVIMTGVGKRVTANYMLKSRGEVSRSLQRTYAAPHCCDCSLPASHFVLRDLPSRSVYRITALLSSCPYIWKSENSMSVWRTLFFSNRFWCGRPFISAKQKAFIFSRQSSYGYGRGRGWG